VKLVLANNQTDEFKEFYADLSANVEGGVDYAAYDSLLFTFNDGLRVHSMTTGKSLQDYDGVYVNGYLSTFELAAATALSCKALDVPFVNTELSNAPSLTKLTEYVKLAAAGVSLPRTIAGARAAILSLPVSSFADMFPAVLKRADADRGIDNYTVRSHEEIVEILEKSARRSVWLLQEFVPNDGFYVITFYDYTAKLCIFRSLEERPDKNLRKAHMYKPRGGKNASLIPLDEVPEALMTTATKAIRAMNRQVGSVDCLYSAETGVVHVLEVNYNPQMVTIDTFKDERVAAYTKFLCRKW
jgi:hypothetical protein